MARIQIKASDAALKRYANNLKDLREKQQVQHEGGTRRAFAGLLSDLAKKRKWTLVEEVGIETHETRRIRVDGALRDQMRLSRAYWEAKDSQDDLDAEIAKKIADGYPLNNIIFEDTQTAILYQNGQEAKRAATSDRNEIANLLTLYLNYDQSVFNRFEEAIDSYRDGIPDIAQRLKARIADASDSNAQFKVQFARFMALCQSSINPNISRDAVEEMLIQHMMTERIIRRVFNVDWFARRNVIAREIEEVIDALTSQHFDRKEFLGGLDGFYKAVEEVADRQADFRAKQDFINMVYERFFQGYSVKTADTHGIVYTPQPIVDFMCAAVEDTLASEFGKKLGDDDVILIDPATGTGNFVVNLLRRAFDRNPLALDDFYKHRLFANEVMLMPYYIASLNIEHQYWQLTGKNLPFPGLCFVDTLDLSESRQLPSAIISEANSQRVQDQQSAKINVIIGNPPYNVGQLNENDNNKNRKYPAIEQRIRETYAKDSNATLKNKLSDAYVKFFRWAVDRLDGRDGIVCYVSNNSFVDAYAFDGFRKNFLSDFDQVYHLDLGGNVRKNRPGRKIGNVFDIRVGVGGHARDTQFSALTLMNRQRFYAIMTAIQKERENMATQAIAQHSQAEANQSGRTTGERIAATRSHTAIPGYESRYRKSARGTPHHALAHCCRHSRHGHRRAVSQSGCRIVADERQPGRLLYFRLPDDFSKEEKLDFLSEMRLHTVPWQRLIPNQKHTWLVSDTEEEFSRISIHREQAGKTRQARQSRNYLQDLQSRRSYESRLLGLCFRSEFGRAEYAKAHRQLQH